MFTFIAPSMLIISTFTQHFWLIKLFILDIEAQIQDIQAKKKELAAASSDKGVGLLESGYYDSELYDEGSIKKNRYEGYMTSIAANDDADEDDDDGLPVQSKRTTYTAPKAVLKDIVKQVNFYQQKKSDKQIKCNFSSFSFTEWKRQLWSVCRNS